MGLDVWFREDVQRIIKAVVIARDGLTTDDVIILSAIGAGFGLELRDVLPPNQKQDAGVVLVLPVAKEGQNRGGGR